MIFWLICAVLTVAATVATLRPLLLRQARGDDDVNPDLRVYKEQLAEVDRDIARGLLTEEEAGAARIEISRRILASSPDKSSETTSPEAASRSGVIFYTAASLIVASTLGLYLVYGSPGYHGQPFAERASRPASGSPVHELIARVEARLREAPDDGQGWNVLAPVYLKQGRYPEAVRAFGRAIALLGENRDRLRGLAEAHLAASNGIVGREVREAYRKILAKEPNLIAPRFWLAVGLEQDGKRDAALAAYRELLRSEAGGGRAALPPPLKRLIEERIAAVSGGKIPQAPLPETGKLPPPPEGMAASMPAKERAAMIEQMVSGLAERLNENGGSEQEWQRLIRAYWVLGRREQAAGALTNAKKQYAGDAAIVQKFNDFARELGMSPG